MATLVSSQNNPDYGGYGIVKHALYVHTCTLTAVAVRLMMPLLAQSIVHVTYMYKHASQFSKKSTNEPTEGVNVLTAPCKKPVTHGNVENNDLP